MEKLIYLAEKQEKNLVIYIYQQLKLALAVN